MCNFFFFSKAYVCPAVRSSADYLLISVLMYPDKANATVNLKLDKMQEKEIKLLLLYVKYVKYKKRKSPGLFWK